MYDIPYTVYGNSTGAKINYPKGRNARNPFGSGGEATALIFDADFVLSESDNKKRMNPCMYADIYGLNADGERVVKGTLCWEGQDNRSGNLKGLAYIYPKRDDIEKIVIVIKCAVPETYSGSLTYKEIGRQTFDFPFVPNGEENYFDDYSSYKQKGYAAGTVY